MQTFLPYAGFAQSALILDDARLRKQQVEAEQISKVLQNPSPKGWANHPAVLQWKGYEDALRNYIFCISEECKRRGFKGRCPIFVSPYNNPPWLSREEIHSSHRSRLLFKGRVDAASLTLKNHLKVRSINTWLTENGFPVKNVFKVEDILRLESIIKNKGLNLIENYYAQFNWSEPDTIPYVWPVQIKKTTSN